MMTISGIANVRRCPHIKRRFNLGYCSKAGPLFQLGKDIPFMFLQTIVLSSFVVVFLFFGGGDGDQNPCQDRLGHIFETSNQFQKGICQNGKIRPE